MSKLLVGVLVAGALAAGAAVAGTSYTPVPSQGQGFKQVPRPPASLTIWIGVACRGGRMEVATTLKGLAPYDCRDRYSRQLTEKEVRGS